MDNSAFALVSPNEKGRKSTIKPTPKKKTLGDFPVLLTVKQVANITSCSEKHIRDCIQRGVLPGTKVGNAYRIGRDTLYAQLGLTKDMEVA